MKLKDIIEQLNIPAQCKKYGIPLWEHPQFLFLVMGLIIIFSSLTTYAIGRRYIDDPSVVALVVLFTTAVLFIVAILITNSFEKLAEAIRMKSEFVSIVSHQLRSPLSNLKWVIELLTSEEKNQSSEKRLEYFGILKENTSRMAELISDLLVVSRIEQGEFPPQKENVSLEGLVRKVIKEREILSAASNVKIAFEAEDNLPEIIADPFQIELALENLLDNAIRYTKGGGEIEMELKRKDKSLRFEIQDGGVGIPQEDQKYIFQKFFRSKNVLRQQTEGSGLGLYITKSVIEKSKGKIGFKSQEGVGSTFWLTIPIKS